MSRRKQHVPWTAAGTASEQQPSADHVVRETGWVFNNQRGAALDLASFVETGNQETLAYLTAFGLAGPQLRQQTMVEIGAGIGRMTASFTTMFDTVIACDLDVAFLERCRETVAQFGEPERMQTSVVGDGRTLSIDDHAADLTFSYITLQHCHRGDALALAAEAVRVTRPGGHVVLNFRTWTAADMLLWPAGKVVRGMWRVPGIGPLMATWRFTARFGWQANRLAPDEVLGALGSTISEANVVRSPTRTEFGSATAAESTFDGVNASHWWLIGTVA